MFQVIEFDQSSGGGVAVVRREWLTPRKKECFWPPEKQSKAFDKILLDGRAPEQSWQLYKIRRIFAVTDELAVAKEKEKKSLIESDLQSDSTEEPCVKRKRTLPAKLVYSSSEEDDGQPNAKIRQLWKSSLPDVGVGLLDDSQNEGDESPVGSPHINLSFPKTSHPSKTGLKTPSVIKPSTSAPGTNLMKSCSSNNFNSGDESLADFSGDNLSCSIQVSRRAKTDLKIPSVVTPIPRATDSVATTPCCANKFNSGPDVIARHLAKIDHTLKEILETQNLILNKLSGGADNNDTTSNSKNILCTTEIEINELEIWSNLENNNTTLVKILSLKGGKNTKIAVSRMLDSIFSFDLAVKYNWTGKNGKVPLKNLNLMKLLIEAVRKNPPTKSSTDSEIVASIQNWFRFIKDRNGGRERRRHQHQQVE